MVCISSSVVNQSDNRFENIGIKKFYQVIFTSEDGDDLDIYTCFSVEAESISQNKKIEIRFEISVNNDGDRSRKDWCVTENHLFEGAYDDPGPWKKMWGNNSRLPKEFDQGLGETELCRILNVNQVDIPGSSITQFGKNKSFIYLSDPNDIKKGISPTLATRIKCDCETSGCVAKYDISHDMEINISAKQIKCGGFFWSRVHLVNDKTNAREEILRLEWEFKDATETKPTKTEWSFEDYKVYIVTPENKIGDLEKSVFYEIDDGEPKPNAIGKQNYNPPVYFKEWINDYGMANRNVYKIVAKNIDGVFKDSHATYRVDVAIKHVPWPHQSVIFSLIASALLAVGIDATRMAAAAKLVNESALNCSTWLCAYFKSPFLGIFTMTLQWMIFVMLVGFCIFFDVFGRRTSSSTNQQYSFYNYVWIIAGIMWIFPIVFMNDDGNALSNLIKCRGYAWIPQLCYGISCLALLARIFYVVFHSKKHHAFGIRSWAR